VSKIKISAVSYTNTKPFVYGLTHSHIVEEIDLSLDIPSECARKLINNEVDLGLVPVAALANIPSYQLISDYCIGANGAVNSVYIFSDRPIEEVEVLHLDLESRTSNNLAKVLLMFYWKLKPEILSTNEGLNKQAFVEIGDRTFGKHDQYPFAYDLAAEWFSYTGLPFVFAVWASNKILPTRFVDSFNKALKYGLDHRKEVIGTLPTFDNFDVENYLMERIDYDLNSEKRKALDLFLDLVKRLDE